MLQKLSARTISKQCGLASAHGARGRKRAQRVNDSDFSEAPSASSSHTVCVEVQKTIPPSFLFSPLSFSLSLTCSPVASSLKLAHCCIDARSKTFTWRMRFTFLLKSLFSSSSHQLSTTKEFQRSWNWGERERKREGRNRLLQNKRLYYLKQTYKAPEAITLSIPEQRLDFHWQQIELPLSKIKTSRSISCAYTGCSHHLSGREHYSH